MNPEITRRRQFLSKRKHDSGGANRLTIGFTCIADFRSFIGQEYISGIVKACEDYDINFINMSQAVKYSIFDDADFLSRYSQKFKFMKAPFLDGLITWASSLANYLTDEQIIQKFSALSPLPMVDIGYLSIPGVTALRIDNTCSMDLIVEHLVKIHSFKRIAFLGTEGSRPHKDRLISFKKALPKFGLNQNNVPVFMAKELTEAEIMHASEELFVQCIKDKSPSERIEAIVTTSDIIAASLIQFLQKRGINVPEDIAVTGFNNQYQGITSSPPVTTINLEYFKRGYMAVELLINRIMDGSSSEQLIKIPTSLIVRESCGCFEKEILDAANTDFPILPEDSTEQEAKQFLFEKVNQIFEKESHESKESLVEAIFKDLYESFTPPKTLCWYRKFLNKLRGAYFTASFCQDKITALHSCLIALAGSNEIQRQRMESITNQLRVLSAVTSDYEIKARDESPYTFNNITTAAIHFASVSTGAQMKRVLKAHLSELGIPGIILSLSDNMTTDLETSNVELIIPEPSEIDQVKLPYRINDVANFPKSFFPKKERYSVVLEILYYNERYFGFAFMHMRNKNMALYDSIRSLLCHSLYEIYLKEGRTKAHSMQLNTKNIEGILSLQGNETNLLGTNKLGVQKISSYLLEHIGEKTNLEKMASELGMNKTKLIRQTKAATGYTVQKLHEKLKIELAKDLILEGKLTLSEIAERLGFQNSNYFSNVFKKNTGESPRAWGIGRRSPKAKKLTR